MRNGRSKSIGGARYPARHSVFRFSTLGLPMASIESLPPDQRAVLQLVLQRGRSYDDIAQLLSIDPAAVRQRAHAALDAIGPGTRVDADRRTQIADYLLGQQSEGDAAQTREHMAGSARERAGGRVVASELTPLA